MSHMAVLGNWYHHSCGDVNNKGVPFHQMWQYISGVIGEVSLTCAGILLFYSTFRWLGLTFGLAAEEMTFTLILGLGERKPEPGMRYIMKWSLREKLILFLFPETVTDS